MIERSKAIFNPVSSNSLQCVLIKLENVFSQIYTVHLNTVRHVVLFTVLYSCTLCEIIPLRISYDLRWWGEHLEPKSQPKLRRERGSHIQNFRIETGIASHFKWSFIIQLYKLSLAWRINFRTIFFPRDRLYVEKRLKKT